MGWSSCWSQIRRHPGQITLIAIGPLSTVQAAIERDPATFRKLKRVVMMGGSIYRGYDDGKNGRHTGLRTRSGTSIATRRGPRRCWRPGCRSS